MRLTRISLDNMILSVIIGLLAQTMIYQFLGITIAEVPGVITTLLCGLISFFVWPMAKRLI